MKKTKDWKKEITRDIVALGSIPFYLIVIIRAVIGEYIPFITQLVVAFPILFILSRISNSHQHIARGLVLLAFTALFYEAPLYTTFAIILWIGMLLSAYYLKSKPSEIGKGILFGAIASALSYGITLLLL